MKFSQIYRRAISFWPEEIVVADGVPGSKGGYKLPTLTAIWDRIEEATGSEDDWVQLVVWCMYQAFHTEARKIHASGAGTLRPSDISPSIVESFLADNLKVEGWAQHAATYENDVDSMS